MTELASKIHDLRKLGYSYRQIHNTLGCSRGTIAYYLGDGQKSKAKIRQDNYRKLSHPFIKKRSSFLSNKHNKKFGKTAVCDWQKLLRDKIKRFFTTKNGEIMEKTFTSDDVINKFGEHPVCYLTGEPIDIYQPRTYQFDHIIPKSRGGDNSLDNLGICTTKANQAKRDMTPDEFINLCKKVVNHNNQQLQ